jgi:hypothetical protein
LQRGKQRIDIRAVKHLAHIVQLAACNIGDTALLQSEPGRKRKVAGCAATL